MNENEHTAEFLTELDDSLVSELLSNENLERIASIIEKAPTSDQSGILNLLEEEKLLNNATKQGNYLIQELSKLDSIETITGRGLMLGVVVKGNGKALRSTLLTKHNIFTGGCANPSVLRLLPPMNITQKECDKLINAIKAELA